MQLVGEVNCFAPGHKLNQMFVREILKDKKNYVIEKAMISEYPEKIYDVLAKSNSPKNINYVA